MKIIYENCGLKNYMKVKTIAVIDATFAVAKGEPEKIQASTLFFLYKNVVFSAQAEYSYFFADFRLKIFLYHS